MWDNRDAYNTQTDSEVGNNVQPKAIAVVNDPGRCGTLPIPVSVPDLKRILESVTVWSSST
jgi:hypothetical protein